MIKFISYDGRWPNLCSGTLVLEIDGVVRTDFNLCSGGSVWFDGEWCEHVESGPWRIEVPEDLKHLQHEIEDVVNINVPHGCCGGCV